MPISTIGLVAATLLGLSDEITLLPSKGDRVHAAWQVSVARIDRPSDRTIETLRRYDVEDRYRRDPESALATLEKYTRRGPEPELIYALAELSWVEGRRAEGRRRGGASALNHYTDTVAYAFDYLFDPALAHGRSPADPRYRLACDLYNGALDRLIRAAKTKDGLKPGSELRLTIRGSEQVMRLALWEKTPWKVEDIDELLLASDFEVGGLSSRSRTYGLGVPLIAVKRTDLGQAEGAGRFYPPEMAFPLTAILRPQHPLSQEPAASVEQVRECKIELVDPVHNRTVREAFLPPQAGAAGHASPDDLLIEADVTTPLAYMWSRTDLNKYRWTGLFRPGQATERAGLMLLRPYEPGKIPVVMVHGLASSPLAWIPMLNELLRDPQIHREYQFFLYLYPTGMPIPIAASGLRDSLEEARLQFNRDGADPGFDRMVLLGHSMGGLLSRAMSVRSDEWFWQMYTDLRFEDIIGPPDVLREIDHYAHFDYLPYVKRVVFLATPHHGSDFSHRLVGRVGSGLISESDYYTKLLARLIKDNPDAFPKHVRHMPTSIETLDPASPVLAALMKMTKNPEAKYNSIIGSVRPEARFNTTDGIVPYSSAHLDGVEELVVRSDHGVQKDPGAIREVRRILLEHLGTPPGPTSVPPTSPASPARPAIGAGGPALVQPR
jgi:triacylglycerol esterase/lipase EstA (alpha/beta hydrolase family)